MDITTISGAIGSLKLASDIAKTLIEAKSVSEIQGKVIELQSAILAAQSSAFAAQSEQALAIQKVRELEEQITSIKAWEAQKERYQLTSPWGNATTMYALKEAMSNGEPPHYICTKCYEDGKRMILQVISGDGYEKYSCPSCKAQFKSPSRRVGTPTYV